MKNLTSLCSNQEPSVCNSMKPGVTCGSPSLAIQCRANGLDDEGQESLYFPFMTMRVVIREAVS